MLAARLVVFTCCAGQTPAEGGGVHAAVSASLKISLASACVGGRLRETPAIGGLLHSVN